MATIREKRELPFTVETMRKFGNVAEAVKYFSQLKQPVRQKRIVNLFNEAHELNFGPVSLNMAVFKKDTKQLEVFIKRTGIFKSEKSVERVKKAVKAWELGNVKQPIEEMQLEETKKRAEAVAINEQSTNSPTE